MNTTIALNTTRATPVALRSLSYGKYVQVSNLLGLPFRPEAEVAGQPGFRDVQATDWKGRSRLKLWLAGKVLGIPRLWLRSRATMNARLTGTLKACVIEGSEVRVEPKDKEVAWHAEDRGPEQSARAKFDRGTRAERPAEQIPWGYGVDRITAMVIDPDRMFLYWEVTDEGIARACRGLGVDVDSNEVWLNLRVHDVTGLLFDGTNSHSHRDIGVSRTQRQWFLNVGKPTSWHCAEVGLMNRQGRFEPIARSGRIDFPRRERAPEQPIQWMRVELAPPAPAVPSERSRPSLQRIPVSSSQDSATPTGHPSSPPDASKEAGERRPAVPPDAADGGEGAGSLASGWQAAPSFVGTLPGTVFERWEGVVHEESEGDSQRVTYGPWTVTMHDREFDGSGRVLGRWRIHRKWFWEGRERRAGTRQGGSVESSWLEGPFLAKGGSEQWLRLGASEQLWQGASERRFQGSSEEWAMGSSEWWQMGSSEAWYAGASERLYRGASERLFRGASEGAFPGASEHNFLGASEAHFRYPSS